MPTPSAGSRTIPLALGAVGGTVVVDVARDIVVDEAPYIVPYIVVDGAPYIDVDAVVLLPDAPEQYVDEPTTPVEDGVACAADPDIVGKEPRPTTPTPLVPRPLVPRPAMPTPAAAGELPGFDEGEDGEKALGPVDVAVREFGGVMTPELLTELHGTAERVPTP